MTKRNVTFGHIMTILGVIIIPLMLWGITIEKRFEIVNVNSSDIKELKNDVKSSVTKMQQNHNEVMNQLHLIELELKDKKDRD